MKAIIQKKGGSGSGNFGHSGRPGKIGGSTSSGEGSGGLSDAAKKHGFQEGTVGKWELGEVVDAKTIMGNSLKQIATQTSASGVRYIARIVKFTDGEYKGKTHLEFKDPVESILGGGTKRLWAIGVNSAYRAISDVEYD